MYWNDKTTVKKGDFGEAIIRDYLHEKGFIIYEPISKGTHPFDKIVVKDKKNMVIVEVKSKARFNKWNCTGIDISVLEYYEFLSKKYNLPVHLYFIDEMKEEIYGNTLKELMKLYKSNENIIYPNYDIKKGLILFSLNKMITVKKLTKEQVEYLKEKSTRNYPYKKRFNYHKQQIRIAF